jgi:hypothetical protein
MATTLMPELPREFLAAARKGQEYALDAIRTWAQTVQSAIPELRTPQFPFADRLPKPETVLANAYDFAGQLLASQRHFAEELLKATEPLMPAIGNGRHAPDATDARQTPATHTARTAPRTPAAHTARTAPEAPAAHTPAAHTATARTAPEAPAAHTPAARTPAEAPAGHTPAARTAPEASAAHTAAASTPRTTRTAPKAAATSPTSTTRTAPKAAASRRQTTPKAGS